MLRQLLGRSDRGYGHCAIRYHPFMGGEFKPIETLYRGYRFRSRLEARWAVFFDVAGIRYDYELEGLDLGPAGWYLPDFWLPRSEVWVEVKPTRPSIQENSKAQQLAMQSGRYVVVLCGTEFEPPWLDHTAIDRGVGEPDEHRRGMWTYSFSPTTEKSSVGLMEWQECPICEEVFLDYWRERHRCEMAIRSAVFQTLEETLGVEEPLDHAMKILNEDALGPKANTPKIMAAYQAAREARFEHGESPRSPHSR